METGYCSIRRKDVVNIKDGKKLGHACDVVFTFPEGKVLGIVVPSGKGFFQPEVFIDLRNIIKIGADTVLVDLNPHSTGCCEGKHSRRFAEQENGCRPSGDYTCRGTFEEE